jgi:PAS domain S-box-containing protein
MKITKTKILAIDDKKDNLISIKALIKESFPEAVILTAQSGSEGIEMAKELVPDVILLDIVMSGLDGFEVCRRLKADENLSEIPVIFLTALKGDKENRIKALEAGGEAFLSKPAEVTELKAMIRAMLKIREASMEKLDEKERLEKLVEERTAELRKTHIGTLNLLEDLQIENQRRKKSEKSLEESSRQFRQLIETLPISLSIVTTEGEVLYINPKCGELFEIKTIPEKRDAFIMWVNPGDRQRWLQEIKTKGAVRNFEMHLKTISGKEIWVLGSGLFIQYENQTCILSTHHDITEVKRTQDALRQSEYQKNLILNTTQEMFAFYDLKLNIIWANKASAASVGINQEELAGKRCYKVWQQRKEPCEGCIVLKAKETKQPQKGEATTPDGKIWALRGYPILDEQGEVINLIELGMDITAQKQAETALVESEERFRKLSSFTFEGIVLHNNGVTIDVNQSFVDMLGYEREELTGMNLFKFIHPDDHEKTKVKLSKQVASPYQIRVIRKDGSTFYAEIEARNISYNNEFFKVACVRDITERKKAESIRQLQYKIARTMISARNLNELFDSIKNELNSIIDAKNLFIALYNKETGILYSPFFKDEKDDYQEWPAEKTASGYVIKKGQTVLLKREDTLSLKEKGLIDIVGTPSEAWLGVPLKVEGKILGVVVVQSYDNPDIYDQTSVEIMELVANELSMFIDRQRSEEKANKLSRAVEQSSVSIVITNREGTIEYVNPFFTKLTGYRLEEAKGKNPNILKSGHQSTTFYQELWDTILSGNDWEEEMLNRKKNGELYWEKALISPIFNSEGVITNFVAIKEDITERKKMIEELVAAKEQAQKSDKLKTAFLNNISHEIRTPLNGILGFGALLLEADSSPQDKKEMLEIVQQSSNRLMNTVTDYIDMARIVSGTMLVQKKEFLLQPFFEEVMEKTKSLCAEKQLDFDSDYPSDASGLTLYSDPEFIRKALHSLLDNALKFTNRGSIGCGYSLKNGFVEFFVKDTGKGIAPEMLDAIFDSFTQEDSSDTRGYEGSGLGLSIASGLVKLLGGTISVTSEQGKDSVFTFTVPCTSTDTAEKEPATGKKNGSAAERPLVLVAEDEESNFLYMKAVLKLTACDCLLAKDGEEAVAFCKQYPEISLVLMDIKMPVMNGLEATRLIREFRPELPIIATTAYAQTGDEQRFLDAGCDGYLAKPIGKDRLLAVLKKYTKRYDDETSRTIHDTNEQDQNYASSI